LQQQAYGLGKGSDGASRESPGCKDNSIGWLGVG